MKKTDSFFLKSYENFIFHLADREYFGQKLGLERIQRLLSRLDHPERKFLSIHIAGTNGKGSTAAMIAAILKEAGYRVGLYTSPHLIDFCERIQVFSPLPPAGEGQGMRDERIFSTQVLHYARVIKEIEEEPLTFFELATAIGFLHFAEQKVNIAVIEVGMGGRLDATNVITPLVSVITSIGLDHTQYLGDSIAKIAFEKAGIIKPGVPVVVGDLPEEAMRVVEKVASDLSSHPPLLTKERGSKGVRSSLSGPHQQKNATVAVEVIDELRRQGWVISDAAVSEGLKNVSWPGRLQTIQKKPWILLDGAHNPEAMRAVRRYLEQNLQGRRLKVLFAAMADKNISGMLEEIKLVASEVVVTGLPMKRAADPNEILNLLKGVTRNGRVEIPPKNAFQLMRESLKEREVLLATGSFYLIGELLQCVEAS